MAIEEDTFYNVLGELVTRSDLVQSMIDLYVEKLTVGETRITDFNEGSEIRNIIESFAVDVYFLLEQDNENVKQCFIETAEGEWLDKHGANPQIQLPRRTGEYSTGYVTFTIPDIISTEVIIPEGTVIVSTDNILDYVTDSDLTISVGDTSVTGSATCLTVGEDGNCPEDTITVIDDNFFTDAMLSVTNEESFTGGSDYEEDDDYRERLLAYVRQDDFGSLPYYTQICENIDGVHDVHFIDDENYTSNCIVNGDVKPTPDSVLSDVLEVLTIVDNIILNHNFTVSKPVYVPVNLTVNLTVPEELDEDMITALLFDLFDGGDSLDGQELEGLQIGETLTKNSLYRTLDLFDIESVTVFITGESTEVSDLSVNENEVLKLETVTINQTISGGV